MKAFTIAQKTLKEAVRQPKNLGLALGLPVAFMLIFGFAFGGDDADTFQLATVDHDDSRMSDGYLDGLAALEYDDGTAIFAIRAYTSEAEAREALASGDHDALVIIPDGFEEDATPRGTPPSPGPLGVGGQQGTPPTVRGASVLVVGDPSQVAHQTSAQIVSAYTAEFSTQVSGPPSVGTTRETVTASGLTPFDFIAPGLMVFAILNMVPQAASILARETETRTLERVRMSPTSAASLLGGVAMAQLVLASVSLALMLLTARLMGFQNQGSYAAAYVIAMGAAVAVVGIGMIIAAFARTQQEAANFGVLVSVPASFLSGAFFALPGVTLGGFDLYSILPTTHAVDALREVMTLGRGIDAVTSALGALAVLAAIYFAAGVVLYRRTRLAAE